MVSLCPLGKEKKNEMTGGWFRHQGQAPKKRAGPEGGEGLYENTGQCWTESRKKGMRTK